MEEEAHGTHAAHAGGLCQRGIGGQRGQPTTHLPRPATGGGEDSEFRDAVRVVVEARKASTSLLQRRLRIGYSKAARIMEDMEDKGIIGPQDGSRPREVLISSLDDIME